MAQLYVMPCGVTASYSNPKSPFNRPDPTPEELYPRRDDVVAIKCACGETFYYCDEKFIPHYGEASFDMEDWKGSWLPFEVEDEMYCTHECAQKYHTSEDYDLAPARGIIIGLIAGAGIWAGIILTALHVWRAVQL